MMRRSTGRGIEMYAISAALNCRGRFRTIRRSKGTLFSSRYFTSTE